MYNVLAHKQLSAYHASWALRPFNPPKRLAAEVAAAAASSSSSARPQSAPLARGGARGRQDRSRPTAGSKSVGSTGSARDVAEGRVDQPDSSASSAASASWAPPASSSLPPRLPPPRSRLALMPGEPVVHSLHAADDVTAVTVQAATSAAALASLPEPDVDVETSGEGCIGGDQFQVACLLRDADGKERLEAVPETRVMFFTETVLDNVHDALTASAALTKSGNVCPAKSALASPMGLAARTRKAVSFSIIADLELDSPSRRRDTGVQVNLIGGEATFAAGSPPAAEAPEAAEAAAESQAHSDPTPPASPGPTQGGISWHDIVLTEKLLKTVPITRTVSPEPKKYIHEGRRWPLRSPRTVYQRVKGHNKLSVSYLLEAAASLNDSTEKTNPNAVALSDNTNPLTLLTTHEEASKEDECDEASDASRGRGHGLQGFYKKGTSTSASEKIQSQPQTSDKVTLQKTESPSNFDTSHYTEGMTSEMPSKPSQDEKKSLTGEVGKFSKESCQGPLGAVAEFVRLRVKKKQPSSPRKQDKKKFQQKERKSKPSRYQRFFPNRYHVDLALVMTLERSRKKLLPSIHSPWNSLKPDPPIKLSKRAIKMSKL